jgi:hypothetical protein
MPPSDEQSRLVALLDKSHRDALEMLQDIDPEKLIYPEGGWRVKDIVAHIAGWEEEMLTSLQAYQNGSEYRLTGFTNDDEYNAQLFLMRKDHTTEQIYANWQDVRARLKAFITDLPLEKFAGQLLFPWGARGTVSYLLDHDLIPHMQEHLTDIQRVLANENR